MLSWDAHNKTFQEFVLEQLVLFLVMVYVKHFHIDVELFLTKQKFLLCIYNLALWLCLYNCDTMVYVSVEVGNKVLLKCFII